MVRKKFVLYLLLILLVLFGFSWFYLVNPVLTPRGPKPFIPVDRDQVYKDVEFLTQSTPNRNHTNLKALNLAGDYIATQLKNAGYAVSFQEFEADGARYKNIIARTSETPGERIVVGAHYDVWSIQEGADDNASAVAGMLEIARLIKSQKPVLPYPIEFVAFTLEEPPYFQTDKMGSYIHAASLAKQKIQIKLMVCLEMIGYFSNEKGSQQFPMLLLKLFYPSRGNFITIVGKTGQWKLVRKAKKLMLKGSEIDVHSINAPGFIPGIDFSDHRNYWNQNYPAILITDTAFFRNPHYHEASDTIQTLNFEKMSQVIQSTYYLLTQFN